MMHEPQPLSALIAKALSTVTNNQQRCPFCGMTHKLIGSAARADLTTTWTAQLEPDCTIPAPPLTRILELHQADVLLAGHSLPLEVDKDIHATDSMIFTANPILDVGTTLQLTAKINLPRVVVAAPHDKCCVSRARQLGERLKETKGNSDESQHCRSYGGYLVAWAKKNDHLLASVDETELEYA